MACRLHFLSLALNGFNPESHGGSANTIAFSEFMDNAEENRVQSVTVIGNDIQGTYTDGTKFQTYAPFDPNMVENLRKLGVKIEARPIDTSESTFWGILISWFPDAALNRCLDFLYASGKLRQ